MSNLKRVSITEFYQRYNKLSNVYVQSLTDAVYQTVNFVEKNQIPRLSSITITSDKFIPLVTPQ